MALAYPTLQCDAREAIACDCFLDTLDDPDLALKVRERASADLDEALTTAMRLEAWANDVRRQTKYHDEKHRYRNRGVSEDDDSSTKYNQLTQRLNVLDNQIAELRKLRAETSMNESRHEEATMNRPQDIPAVRTGVFQPSRPNVYRERESTMAWPRKRASSDRLVCWSCGQPGHIRRNCDQRPPPWKEAPMPRDGAAKMLHGVDRANVYLVMALGGRRVPCLLDTGCDLTMVPREVINLVADVEIRPTTHRMWAANGTEVQIDGEATIPFVMEGRRLDTTAIVSPDIEEPMIGSEWMKAHRCLWDFQGSQLYIDGRAVVTLTQRKKLRCRRLYADQEVVVPARHQVVVPARATLFSLKWLTGNTIVETRQMEPAVYLGQTLLPPEHHDLCVSASLILHQIRRSSL